MADFRKVILVLAVLAVVAAPASAQLACTARATPAQIRAEGITELVGDVILTCTNDAARNVSIEAIIGSTNITNAIIDDPTIVNAYAVITDAANVTATPISARLTTPNSVVWQNVTIPVALSPASILIRLTNIRVNASALGVGTGGTVTQVQETVLVSGTNVLDVPNNVLNVAAARTGLFFDVSDADGSPFQACLGKSAPTGETVVAPDFQLTFTEGFGNAFKVETLPANPALPPNAEENVTFATLGITSGFVQGVTNATQLRAVFSGVPAGVSVWVTTAPLAGEGNINATLVAGTTATGAGGGYRRVVLTDGAGEAIWEVVPTTTGPVAPDPAKIEDAVFGVLVSFPANVQLPPITGVTAFSQVGGSFAPISDVFVAAELDEDDAPIPRFVDTATLEDTFQVVACVTNLLFPYITNQFGFDTGIALVNTSNSNFTGEDGTPADQPFDTIAQTGTCTLYYFGETAAGAVVQPQTTVPIGEDTTSTVAMNKVMVTFALSQGGPTGTTGAAGFSGYMIARCNFQFGHGFAFITDLGAQRLAQGYLALVIPDRGANVRLAVPFGGTGEQLVN